MQNNEHLDRLQIHRCNLGEAYINEPLSLEDFKNLVVSETKKGMQILDAGAGEGGYREIFKDTGAEYTGVDSGVGNDSWDYGKIISGDLENLDFISDEKFDIVLLIQVLEHLENPDKVMSELSRVTRKGGKLFAAFPQSQGVHQIPYDYNRYTPYGLKALSERHGFEIRKIQPQYFGDNAAACQKLIWTLEVTGSTSSSVFHKLLSKMMMFKLKACYRPFCRMLDKRLIRHTNPVGYFAVLEKV